MKKILNFKFNNTIGDALVIFDENLNLLQLTKNAVQIFESKKLKEKEEIEKYIFEGLFNIKQEAINLNNIISLETDTLIFKLSSHIFKKEKIHLLDIFDKETTSLDLHIKTLKLKPILLDPNDSMAFTKKDAILKAAGYKPGSNTEFYGNNQAVDVGAQILAERNAQQPTEQDLIDAGLDPNEVSVVNSNAANAFYLEQELANRGINPNQTAGRIGSTAGFLGGDQGSLGTKGATSIQQVRDNFDSMLATQAPDSYWMNKSRETGMTPSEMQLDMLEWDLIKKKAEENSTGATTKVGATGITTGGVGTGTPGGGISGGFTTDPNTLDISSSAVTPTLSTSQITPGASGTYTTPAQTFEQNLTDQATDFQNRAIANQQFIKPQTVSEKIAAGEDVASYAISQKLYRNPQTGHQLFIAFQGNQPLAPIPAGYYEVNQQTGAMASGAFNPVTAGA